MARRRRGWLGVAVALLLSLLLWLALLPAPRLVTAPPGGEPPPELAFGVVAGAPRAAALGPRPARSPGAPPLGDGGVELAPAGDGGGGARPALRGHLLIDPCTEPLPGDGLDPPEGLRVEVAGAARVAYAPDWLDRRDARALATEVDAALTEAGRLLGTAPRGDLLVVTWPDREAMTEAKEGVDWAQAMYDGAVHVPVDASERSLRHEVLHAQLHATAPCVPYWLDEGLAAYFEGVPGNRAYTWLRMIRAPLWIPFRSLAEPLREDEGADAMEPAEVDLLYAQSLGMATMLVDEGALERALAASNAGTSRGDLWPYVAPGVDGRRLIDFLGRRLFPELDAEQRARLQGAGFACRGLGPEGLPRCEPILPGSRLSRGARSRAGSGSSAGWASR